jgi:predicted metal-dependent hydrolase
MDLDGLSVDVLRKDMSLRVFPPTGRVRISAPWRMSLDALRAFALSKLPWIRERRKRVQERPRESPLDFLDLECRWVWGVRFPLKIVEQERAPRVDLEADRMVLRVRPGSDGEKMRGMLDAWHRDQVRRAAPPLIAKWEPILNVKANRVSVRNMRTRWGSCSPKVGNIRLNSRLAEKPRECLEHVVVHELVHLLEPSHNRRFKSLMNQFLPQWKSYRKILNGSAAAHEFEVD